MQASIDDIRKLDGEVLAVSSDGVEDLRTIADAYSFSFSLLSDPELAVIDAYGLRHAGAGFGDSADIARPAVFVIDRQGRIVWRDLTDNWRVRVRPETVLAQLAALP